MPSVTESLPSFPRGRAFGRAEYADFKGSLQLLTSSHLRERDKMLSRAILCGGVWDGDGHLFWECTFSALLHVGELPELSTLVALDRSNRPRCLSWRGWLPGLSSAGGKDPWETSFVGFACCKLECRLGAYPVDTSAFGTPPEHWDADDLALEVSDTPKIWTDGRSEDFSSPGGFEVAGASVCVPACGIAFEGSVWSVAEEYGDARLERCRAFLPVPGPLQTAQRAEFWGAISAGPLALSLRY